MFLTLKERELLIREKVKNRSQKFSSEKTRAAYCVITGYTDEKSKSEIKSFYQIDEEDLDFWWSEFELPEVKEKVKKSKTKDKIFAYLKTMIDNEITAKELCENCDVSLPTAYNFINSNIGWFKKVRRGTYKILDGDLERQKAKENQKK